MESYKELEEKFAQYVGTKYAVSVNTGTAALTLALASLGIGEGDEVIVPEFTMIACAWAVTYLGAKPVFVDCGDDLLIDKNLIEGKITPKTRAIMPVHIYGRVCDMDSINAIAKKHNLYVVEDCAEAHGATLNGAKAGSLGDLGCFSLYRNKIISSQEGGIVTTNSKELYEIMQDIKSMSFGKEHNYLHKRIGFNFRMPNATAKLALKSLSNVERELRRRARAVQKMRELYKFNEITRPEGSVYWVYDFLFDSERERNAQIRAFAGLSRHFFKPMSMQPMYLDEFKHLKAYDYSRRGMYIDLTK